MNKQALPIPVTVISGFLGAGKTTLVNHLLRNADGRKLVVLVNDFGELPIDVDLIESVDNDTINLANGCACCSMGGDLFNAFINVLERNPPPDHLIIEASGVADPARIANFARAEPDLNLNAIVSIIDAENIKSLINDERLGPTVTQQMTTSDLIVLNKVDLISQSHYAKIETLIEKTSPHTTQLPTQFSKVPFDLIASIDTSFSSDKQTKTMIEPHGKKYQKWSKKFNEPISRPLFEEALEALGDDVLRLKGIVAFQNNSALHVVHWVLGRYSITPLPDQEPHSNFSSSIIAIGLEPEFDRDHLNQSFQC